MDTCNLARDEGVNLNASMVRRPPALLLALSALFLLSLACNLAGSSDAPGAPETSQGAREFNLESEPEPGEAPPLSTSLPAEEEPAPPQPMPTQVAESTPQVQAPAIQEARRVTVEWPGSIRVGDADVIRLSLEMDDQGNITPTAQFAGNEVRSEPVVIPDLYETHNVLAEARLDLVGLAFSPQGTVSQTLLPGQRVDFFWSVSPQEVGDYRGTVWLFLRFVPHSGEPAVERTVAAQVVTFRAVNILGLGGAPARWLGAIGTALGSLLGLDDLVSWVRRRRRLR